MPFLRVGTVTKILSENAQKSSVELEGGRRAVAYARYTQLPMVGESVLYNSTATDLELGTGGDDFVVANLTRPALERPSGGHILKLRYTPLQADVVAVEAPESPHHEVMKSATSLNGSVVVAASLHSQLACVVAGIRSVIPKAKVVYVMTDGGGLEASWSTTVKTLRELGELASVITAGHALGGDLEAVAVPSALVAGFAVAEADIVICGMGPGVVGTSTPLGTTATELASIVNFTTALGGRSVIAPRMSVGDARDRHRGLSHHTTTALQMVLEPREGMFAPVVATLGSEALAFESLHLKLEEVEPLPFAQWLKDLESKGVPMSHMGRSLDEDPLFFESACAAGVVAARIVSNN